MVNPDLSYRNEHFLPQFRIAQFSNMHYHYRLRMSSAIDRSFFWNTLVGSRERVANGSTKHSDRAETGAEKSSHSEATTATATAASAVQRKFEAIPNRTIDQLAMLYAVDLKLWQQFLDKGTPRQPGEETMYDYYLQTRGRQHGGGGQQTQTKQQPQKQQQPKQVRKSKQVQEPQKEEPQVQQPRPPQPQRQQQQLSQQQQEKQQEKQRLIRQIRQRIQETKDGK